MIKIVVKGKDGVANCRSKIHCKGTRTLIGEASSAMAALIAAVCKDVPGLKPEMLTELAVELYRSKENGAKIPEVDG